MIYTGPITHTHFVQTAEPSRVAVRQPSPQRTSLAVISKYTDHSNPTTMQPVHAQLAFFFFFSRQLTSKSKELVALKALHTSWQVNSFPVSTNSLLVSFQYPTIQAVYAINISPCVDIFKSSQCSTFLLLQHQCRKWNKGSPSKWKRMWTFSSKKAI